MNRSIIKLLIIIILGISACKKSPSNLDQGTGTILVLNQGGFNKGEASVSLYDPVKMQISHNIFSNKNGRPLGDVLQSARLISDKLYLVINNSHKIEVVNPEDYLSIQTIKFSNGSSPRYIHPIDNQHAYVTSFSDFVFIVNTVNLMIIDSIFIGSRTEGISVRDGKAYVSNIYNSDFSPGSSLTVINTATHQIVNTIETGKGPGMLEISESGMLYVSCGGEFALNNGSVVVINTQTDHVVIDIPLNTYAGSIALNENMNRLFVIADGVKSINLSTNENEGLHISGNFYGIASFNDEIYVADALNYQQSGIVYRYKHDGTSIDTFSSGIIPAGFYKLN